MLKPRPTDFYKNVYPSAGILLEMHITVKS